MEMTSYLEQDWNEKITNFAKKQAKKFEGSPKSVKQMLDSMDRTREGKKEFREQFYSSRERNPDEQYE